MAEVTDTEKPSSVHGEILLYTADGDAEKVLYIIIKGIV